MEQQLYELPEGWCWKPLSTVADMSRKSILPESGEDYNYIGLEHIEGGTGRLVDFEPTKGNEIASTKTIFSRNMVLYGKLRPYLNKVHVAEFEGIATTEIIPFACHAELDAQYLAAYMRSEFFLNAVMGNCSGARMPRATTKFFKDIARVPLPPLNEQKRIVAKLDALFTRIDAAITHLQETLELSKALFASVLDGAFRECEAESVSLTEVVDFIGGSQPPKSEFSEVAHEGYVRLIQIRDYKTDAHIVYVNAKSTKKFCKEDDVMIGRYGPPVFQILRGLEGGYNVALMKASPDESFLSKDYLFWFLQSPSIQGYIVGLSQRAAGQSGVNKKALEKYKIPLPSLDEQATIVEHFEILADHTRTLEVETQERLEQLAGLKSSLLDAAFRGQLFTDDIEGAIGVG